MFNNVFHNSKVLITGHTGFKGSWLSAWLKKLGADVIGVSKGIPSVPAHFDIIQKSNSILSYDIDIRLNEEINSLICNSKPDFIFHLAAQSIVSKSYDNPLETWSTNTMGTANILNSLRNLNKECIAVIITSDKCYENKEWFWGYRETDELGGSDPYSASKGSAELVFKSFYKSYFSNKDSKIRLASARAGNVIGGGDWGSSRLVPDAVRSWSKNQSVELRSPNSTRPWQHVLEPLSGYLWLAAMLKNNSALNGESFNFGPTLDSDFPVQTLIKKISTFWPDSKYFLKKQSPDLVEANLLKLSCEKATNLLKWNSVLNFSEMCEFTANWYRCYYFRLQNENQTNKDIENYVKLGLEHGLDWTS